MLGVVGNIDLLSSLVKVGTVMKDKRLRTFDLDHDSSRRAILAFKGVILTIIEIGERFYFSGCDFRIANNICNAAVVLFLGSLGFLGFCGRSCKILSVLKKDHQ